MNNISVKDNLILIFLYLVVLACSYIFEVVPDIVYILFLAFYLGLKKFMGFSPKVPVYASLLLFILLPLPLLEQMDLFADNVAAFTYFLLLLACAHNFFELLHRPGE